jgi:hypothetical protein
MVRYIILGKDIGIHKSISNFYRYSFSDSPNNAIKTIFEKEHLNEEEQHIAFEHWAEFSAWYVFAKFNPLQLADDDVVAFISGEMFKVKTEISPESLNTFNDAIESVLVNDTSVGFFYSFPNRDLHATYPEEWFWSHINEEFWRPIAIKTKLRTVFTNLPNINRNYIVCRMDALKRFVSWIENNLLIHFFVRRGLPDDKHRIWNKVKDNIDVAGQCPSRSHGAYADRYRVFGMIIEFFHYRYFEKEAKQFIITKDININRIQYDQDLNHTVIESYNHIKEMEKVMENTITVTDTITLAKLLAQLLREGVVFEARQIDTSTFEVHLKSVS